MRLIIFKPLAGLLLALAVLTVSTPSFAEETINCEGAKKVFKDLYTKISSHAKGLDSKIFEDALLHEYQNSLTKVAKLYQISKQNKHASLKQNSTLIEFFKALDKESGLEGKFDDLLDSLKTSSILKNATAAEQQFIINDNDIYLLRQLLNHTADCKDEKPGEIKRDTPINRMLYALQRNDATKDKSNLIIVDTKTVIDSAIAKQMATLRAWTKQINADNPSCFKVIKNDLDFTQSDVQGCHYKKFVDSLITIETSNVATLQSILHFISTTQKDGHLNFEAFINQTFNNILEGKALAQCSATASPEAKPTKEKAAVVSEKEKKCYDDDKDPISRRPLLNWSWDSATEKCIEKEKNKDDDKSTNTNLPLPPETKEVVFAPDTPITADPYALLPLPRPEQMSVLPGSP